MTDASPRPSTQSEILLGIGRLEGRVEQFLHHQTRHEDRLNEHDNRLAALESDKSRTRGFKAGVLAAWGALTGALGWLAADHGGIFK